MNCYKPHKGHNQENNNFSDEKGGKKISWTAIITIAIIISLLVLSAFAFH